MFYNTPLVITHFKEEDLEKGIELADQGNVIHYDLDEESGIITGQVEENGIVYQVKVSIDDPNNCKCSCHQPFCRHQSAIFAKATSEYTNNFVRDLLEDYNEDQLRSFIYRLMDRNPELLPEVSQILMELEMPELFEEDEEDEEEIDSTDIDYFILKCCDQILQQQFTSSYHYIIDFINHLEDEEKMDIEKLSIAVQYMIRLQLVVEQIDEALYDRITQWIDAHQNSYLNKYSINILLIAAKQNLLLHNPYVDEAEAIRNTNYLRRAPSTTAHLFELLERIDSDEEMENETKEYAVNICIDLLGDIYRHTQNQKVIRTILNWFEANHEYFDETYHFSIESYLIDDPSSYFD